MCVIGTLYPTWWQHVAIRCDIVAYRDISHGKDALVFDFLQLLLSIPVHNSDLWTSHDWLVQKSDSFIFCANFERFIHELFILASDSFMNESATHEWVGDSFMNESATHEWVSDSFMNKSWKHDLITSLHLTPYTYTTQPKFQKSPFRHVALLCWSTLKPK